MKIKIAYIILLTILMLAGCTDTVTNHYDTRTKAEADYLFDRGWLPRLIPVSARDITTSNDLDTNKSEGQFYYDIKETNDFIKHLKPLSNRTLPISRWQAYIEKQKKEGYDPYEYISEKTIWIFLANPRTGHVRYMMWILK
jgi:hypothetical protein